MRRSKLNDLLSRFLKSIGIRTSYSRRLEIEKKLQLMFLDASGMNRHILNKGHRQIQIVRIRDALRMYITYL